MAAAHRRRHGGLALGGRSGGGGGRAAVLGVRRAAILAAPEMAKETQHCGFLLCLLDKYVKGREHCINMTS